jgi:acyl-homoserine-lactone acylase
MVTERSRPTTVGDEAALGGQTMTGYLSRRWTFGALLTLAGVVVAGLLPAPATAATPTPVAGGAVVRRTEHGTPHILAADYRGLGLGAGYSFAEDNLCVLADDVVTLSGQRSRWFGPDGTTVYGDNNLASDIYHTWVNQSLVVERLLASPAPIGPSAQARDLVRGYVAGYNRYLAEHPVASLPDPACRDAQWVRPITELDIWRRTYQLAELSGGEAVLGLVASAQPPGATAAAPALAPADGLARLKGPDKLGSNAIGIGRSASVGHTGLVLGNPHFPWVGDRRFYQQQLTIPGEIDVSGASLYGLPVVNIGHTDKLAWSHTVSTAQTFTLSQLALAPGNPTSYVVDGSARRMDSSRVTVPVRQPNGAIAPVMQTVYRTPDGPIVTFPGLLDWTTTTAYALHDANAGNLRIIDQWLAMDRSHTVAQLRTAEAKYLGIPWVNTVAADSTGSAYYADVQVVPNVSDALLARCGTGPPIGLFILDGSRSNCAWGNDSDAVSPGLFGPSRLPSLTRTDFVSNMNDSPWLANPAAPITGYPAIVGDIGTPRSPRTRMGLDMIADRLDGSDGLGPPGFTLPTLQATMLGNRNLTAEEGRAAVVAMCQANPNLQASDGQTVNLGAACATIAAWNGRGDIDSRGAYLWRAFIEIARGRGVTVESVPFDPNNPVRTPSGVAANQVDVRQAFVDAVQAFGALGVPVDVPLGAEQHYAGVPIHGCDEQEGCFNAIAVPSPPGPGGDVPDVSFGSSFIMAAELTASGPRTRTILIYGESANVASPYHADQVRLYSAKQWVTDRFTDAEISSDPQLTVRTLRP